MRRELSILMVLGTMLAWSGACLWAVSDPSLVGWWKFDDGSGTAAVDSSGNGNDGVLNGAPKWVPGKLGGALEFNGTDAYVQVNRTIQDDFTMMGWIKTATPGAAGQPVAAWQGSGLFWSDVGGTANDFILAVYGKKMCFCAREDNTMSAKDVVTGDWVHVAVTRAVVGAQEIITLYNNGGLDTEVSSDWIAPLNANPNISIGANPLNSRFYTGLIDDVRFYTRALDANEIHLTMIGDPQASSPYPKDKGTDVPRDTILGWKPSINAATHDVYFGTDYNDVNDATATSPLLVSKGQAATTYPPAGLLDFGQTYYWRVDEVNAPDKPGLFKGDTWSFTAETYGYPITTPIKATASSHSNALTGPEKTIDGSGLDALDQHSIVRHHRCGSARRTRPRSGSSTSSIRSTACTRCGSGTRTS